MFYVCRVCIQDQSFNNFENNTMKLSVKESKLSGLWARNCATIQKVLIKKFAFGPEKLPVLSRNGPLAMKFAFCVFLSFYGFCGFYSRSSECASRFKLFSSLESFKTKCEYFKMTFFVRSSSLCMLYFWRKRHDLPWLTTTHFKTYKKSLYTLLFFCLAWSEKDSWRVAEIPNFTQIEDGVRNKRA